MSLNLLDYAVIAAYVVGCLVIGARIGAGASAHGLKGYFLGESNIPAWAVMISIVATETSAVTFLSVPGVGYRGDFTFLQLAMGYILARIVVTYVLLPSFFRGEIFTAYQVLQERFGGATQKAASILFLVTRMLASGLRLFLAAKVLQVITGWGMPASIVVIGVATIVYTLFGGIKAVVWIDVIQFAVYLFGAFFALQILVGKIPGGIGAIVEQAQAAGKFRIFNFSTDLTIPYTFWAGVIGGLVLDTATHGVDQMMVQRYLTARSQKQAGGALIVSGFVILAQFALFLFIGVGLWSLYKVEPPTGGMSKDQEFAYFIIHYLPNGLLGLVIAAIFSVTMSTLSGALSASASSTINDLYRPIFPQTDERRLLILSKVLTGVWGLVVMGVALAASRGLDQSVIDAALQVASFVTGILLGIFLLGIWTKNVGQAGAFVGMIAGIALVSYLYFGTKVAYPWYAPVGSSTVVLVGLLTQSLLPRPTQA